jgi:hypothetical protein
MTENVFWAEADDFVQRREHSLGALYAYLLLRTNVVVHPAYFLQSDSTESVLQIPDRKLLTPPTTKLILGDSPSAEAYIADRIERLSQEARNNPAASSELDRYLRHGGRASEMAKLLDNRFPGPEGVLQISWSRDARFRKLIREDLARQDRVGSGLYARIFQASDPPPQWRAMVAIERLIELTYRSHAEVNLDSILNLFAIHGFDRRRLRGVSDRLHSLHWESQYGESLEVPFLGRHAGDQRLHPLDSEVFWFAVRHMLALDLRARLLGMNQWSARDIVMDLRQDPLWRLFVDRYRAVVSVVNEEWAAIREDDVLGGLRQKYPRFHFGRMISVWTVLSFACGAVTLSGGSVITTAISGVGFAATSVGLFKEIVALVNTWVHSDLVSLRSVVQSHLGSEPWRH